MKYRYTSNFFFFFMRTADGDIEKHSLRNPYALEGLW